MKRKQEFSKENSYNKKQKISDDFIVKCKDNFNNSEINMLAKNAVTNVGSLNASTDHFESTKVSHVFLNSIKKKKLKATNQGYSGRCWIFSGLNVFRHNIINGLELENFEFSETYLYFWDKFERSNCFLQWIREYMDKKEYPDLSGNKMFEYLVDPEKYMSDGGYWTFFANLIEKYGLIPKTAMPETFQSEYSDDMNKILMDILHSTANKMRKTKKDKHDLIIEESLKQVYNTLVKFLGEPPSTFDWSSINENGETNIIPNLNPKLFLDTFVPIDISEFVVLSNVPNQKYPYYKKYEIEYSTNIIDGKNCEAINLPINELKKYAMKSVLSGIPVWFGADVSKGFHPYFSSLNDKLLNNKLLFGSLFKMSKEERMLFQNQQTNHAMTLTGVNIDEKNLPYSWEVENSWGYFDNEEPGKDGFLCMDNEWFEKYIGHIVIHKKFLSRNICKIFETDSIKISPLEQNPPLSRIKYKNYSRYISTVKA